MKDISGDIFSFDGKVYNINTTTIDSLLMDEDTYLRIYEVIRIIGGKPLFFEDHFTRLIQSVERKKVNLSMDFEFLKAQILDLSLKNRQLDFNCMITCFFKENQSHILIFIRKHSYPSDQLYKDGVNVELLKVKRHDPNVKYVDDKYNKVTTEAKSNTGVFEVLLVDDNNQITEASKSNVFFIKGNQIITAPSAKVLLGVTRKHVIDAIKEAKVDLVEEEIPIENINLMDGVFLTGTSLHMLPVSNVSNQTFNTVENNVFTKVKDVYYKILDDYLRG